MSELPQTAKLRLITEAFEKEKPVVSYVPGGDYHLFLKGLTEASLDKNSYVAKQKAALDIAVDHYFSRISPLLEFLKENRFISDPVIQTACIRDGDKFVTCFVIPGGKETVEAMEDMYMKADILNPITIIKGKGHHFIDTLLTLQMKNGKGIFD